MAAAGSWIKNVWGQDEPLVANSASRLLRLNARQLTMISVCSCWKKYL